jgi:hypothetical protein
MRAKKAPRNSSSMPNCNQDIYTSVNSLGRLWQVMTGEKSDYFYQLELLWLAQAAGCLSGYFDVLVKKLKKPTLLASLEREVELASAKRPALRSSRKQGHRGLS